MRYTIGTFRTFRLAHDTLEDMYANGEISEGERPDILPITIQIEANGVVRWITRYELTAEG